jgi:hypothetical protein
LRCGAAGAGAGGGGLLAADAAEARALIDAARSAAAALALD